MDAQEGFERYDEKTKEPLFCELKKVIYGTKQGGRRWYVTLLDFFVRQEFVP